MDGEGGKRGAGRDFLGLDEGEDGEFAFATDGRFGESGAGELIRRRLDEGGGDDGEGVSFDERWMVGDESEASLCEGVTKLVNPGKRNRCWSFPYSTGRLSCLSRSSPC